jgi:hypothetical protein
MRKPPVMIVFFGGHSAPVPLHNECYRSTRDVRHVEQLRGCLLPVQKRDDGSSAMFTFNQRRQT